MTKEKEEKYYKELKKNLKWHLEAKEKYRNKSESQFNFHVGIAAGIELAIDLFDWSDNNE